MKTFEIAGMKVRPGFRKDLKIRIGESFTSAPVFIPVTVAHGVEEGPALCVTAAVHGDEINGIEIVRRVRTAVDPAKLRGTVVLVMIANPIAFLNQTRDLPDGRDLNRSFPGRERGSMAAHVARAIFGKIVRLCDYVVDLHTARSGRANLPHVRADMRIPGVRRLAAAFGTEVIFDKAGEEGTLRHAATSAGISAIVYEGGEALKFQEDYIVRGVEGVRNVLADFKMCAFERVPPRFQAMVTHHEWIRARKGGILNVMVKPGDVVEKGDTIAVNTRPFGTEVNRLKAPRAGLVVGCTTVPMAIPGSAVCHLVPLGSRYRVLRKLLRGRRHFPG